MSRLPRNFQPGYCYHITVRCNNRDFRLTHPECKQLLLKIIKETRDKYGFKLYALCIMSNNNAKPKVPLSRLASHRVIG